MSWHRLALAAGDIGNRSAASRFIRLAETLALDCRAHGNFIITAGLRHKGNRNRAAHPALGGVYQADRERLAAGRIKFAAVPAGELIRIGHADAAAAIAAAADNTAENRTGTRLAPIDAGRLRHPFHQHIGRHAHPRPLTRCGLIHFTELGADRRASPQACTNSGHQKIPIHFKLP